MIKTTAHEPSWAQPSPAIPAPMTANFGRDIYDRDLPRFDDRFGSLCI